MLEECIMNKLPQFFLICLLFCFLFAGCRQEGCIDSNAVNYNFNANKNDGFCAYRYLSSVIVNKIPQKNWDTIPGYNNPNLKFYLKKSNEIFYELETPLAANNLIYPYLWKIEISSGNYLLWNMTYEFLLSNEKFIGRDIIFNGTFIPSKVYNIDKIILKNKEETVEIELNFVVF
jgi:hypothetical protein